MAKKSHNKKRNVGIIYEQLVLKLSQALVENDKKTFSDTKSIIKKFFAKKTELFKEYRLLNSLAVTNITNGAIVPSILSETKSAIWNINERKLNYEKSRLIRKINETFGKSFYSMRVPNYKDLATIQLLINEFKNGRKGDPQILAEYSSKVSDILLREKKEETLEEIRDPEIDSLVVRLMTEKFNKFYSKSLNSDQIEIMNEWIVTKGSENKRLDNLVRTAQVQAISEIDSYVINCDNDMLLEKAETVRRNVKDTEFSSILDEVHVAKAMTMCQIIKEMSGDEDE